MSLFDEIAPAPKKVMTLFYLVDSSGSMSGEKIGTVNSAMEEAIVSDLPEIASNNDDAEINVAIMEFNTGCRWKTPESGPIPLGSVTWDTLSAGGLTAMGAAFRELDSKLSKNAFLKSATGAYAPVMLLLSDGAPTDDWKDALDQLKSNNWYKNGIKIAFAIGNDADFDVLAMFTGTREAVIRVSNKVVLHRLIRKVSVRASAFQSHSKGASDIDTTPEENAADIVKDVIEEMNSDPNIQKPEDWETW